MGKAWTGTILLFVFWGLSPAWAQLSAVYVDGKAEYKASLSSPWQPVEEGNQLSEAGYVRTGPQSSLELESKGKARLVIAENTLARLLLDQKSGTNRLLVHAGAVLTEVLRPGTALQVRTKTMALGVRGTKFTVLASPRQGAEVAVNEGKVFVIGRDPGTNQSQEDLLTANTVAKVVPDGGLAVSAVQESDRDYYDFGAFDDMAKGKRPQLFDHYKAEQDRFFQEFQEQDLADYQLFLLDDYDQQWNFYLQDRQALADQLLNSPLGTNP